MAIGYGEACQKPQPRVLDRGERKYAREKKASAFRTAVWKDSGYRCYQCGCRVRRTLELVPEQGHVHHIVARSLSKAKIYDADNGVVVCGVCHMKLTRHEITLKASR